MSETSLKSYTATTELDSYIESLSGPTWLRDLRTTAAARFKKGEWPTTRDEEWRRTSLRAFEFDSYQVGGPLSTNGSSPAATGESTAGSADAESAGATTEPRRPAGHLAFENDTCVSGQVTGELAAAGVVFAPLSGELGGLPAVPDAVAARVGETFAASVEAGDTRFHHWHYALVADAAVLYVPRFVEIADPFVIDFHLTGDEAVRAPHVVVILEEGARATVVKRLTSGEEGEVMVVAADEFIVGDAARLQFSAVQRLNDESLIFSNGRASVGRDAQLHCDDCALGADFAKGRFDCDLVGAGADATLNGIYFGIEEQHLDLRTVQRHIGARTTSRAFYRGAARGESHTIYQGLITVDAEARGTDAYLTNKNLILSDEARADSIPSLNISTDDVKCSHGSTTGKLDDAQIFYLQSRGYGSEEARLLLIEGFFEDLIAQTPHMIQEELRGLIAAKLSDPDDE